MRIPGTISFIHFLRDVYSMTTKTRLKHKTSHAPAGSKQYIQLLPLFLYSISSSCQTCRNDLPWMPYYAVKLNMKSIAHNEKHDFHRIVFVIYLIIIFWMQ